MQDDYDYSRINVLLVDDNRHMLGLLRAMLGSMGVRDISDCVDAVEAFEVCRSRPIDLCFCDLNMSPIDGIEFLHLIRRGSDSPNRYLPVIMLTAHTERHRVESARDAGVNEFLAKPVRPKDLLRRLYSVIENPRPFVRAPGYFGPDRRRRDDPGYMGPERRQNAETSVVDI